MVARSALAIDPLTARSVEFSVFRPWAQFVPLVFREEAHVHVESSEVHDEALTYVAVVDERAALAHNL
jgi:hypothetical protein